MRKLQRGRFGAPFFISIFHYQTPKLLMTEGSLPVPEKERIQVIDTIRGIALLGILMMNIPYFAEYHKINDNIFVFNETSGINYYTWWIINGGFEGTMRCLFSLLFGAGTVLLLQRLEKKQLPPSLTPADIYYRRLFVLLIFGVINAFIFLWPGDILYNYAVCGLFLYPFRNWSPKKLLIAGLIIMAICTFKETRYWYKSQTIRVKGEKAMQLQKDSVKLNVKQEEELGKYTAYLKRINVDSLRKEAIEGRKEMHQGYFGIMKLLKPINVKFESSKLYNLYFWDVLYLFFFGMALLKWGVLTGKRSNRFYAIMMLIGYGIGLPLAYFILNNYLAVKMDRSRFAERLIVNVYQERRLLIALGHLGLIMLLYKNGILSILWRWLSRVGQMAFTNYLMQSLIGITIFYGFGFAFFGTLERYQWYIVVGCIWTFQIIFSNLWLKYFRFGPFEWLWRSLTYWKKQPMKR
jgi:uncharacterized protein